MYTTQFELMSENHCIVQILKDFDFSIYVLIEDTFRNAELHKDHPFLFPEIYKTEQEFQKDSPDYNLIKLTIFPLFDMKNSDEKNLEEFEWLASNLIEHRPETAHTVIWNDDEMLKKSYHTMDLITIENRDVIYNRILSFADHPIKVKSIPGHLKANILPKEK